MDDATFYILIFGSFLVAFGVFSLYFSSASAQRKFNPDGAPFHRRKRSIIVESDYRVRPKPTPPTISSESSWDEWFDGPNATPDFMNEPYQRR